MSSFLVSLDDLLTLDEAADPACNTLLILAHTRLVFAAASAAKHAQSQAAGDAFDKVCLEAFAIDNTTPQTAMDLLPLDVSCISACTRTPE